MFNRDQIVEELKANKIKTLDLSATKKAISAQPVASFHTHNVIKALAVLLDGKLASGSLDGMIKLWDTQTQQCVATLEGHNEYVSALTVLPDGRLASGSGDKTIKLWDTQTQQCLATLGGA